MKFQNKAVLQYNMLYNLKRPLSKTKALSNLYSLLQKIQINLVCKTIAKFKNRIKSQNFK